MPNDDTVGKGGWGGENVSKSDGAILECSLTREKCPCHQLCSTINWTLDIGHWGLELDTQVREGFTIWDANPKIIRDRRLG